MSLARGRSRPVRRLRGRPRDAIPRRGGDVGRRLTVVVNGRASGVADADAVGTRARAVLERAGARRVTIAVTQDLDDLARAIEATGDGRVVLAGGDGAVHAFANHSGPLPEVALLPAGRANNIARSLGIPVDWERAAGIAVAAAARPVDALEVQTPERTVVAVEGVSAGFHAAARHRYTADNSAALGEGLHALAAELGAFHPYGARIALDGSPWHDGELAQVFFANLPLFGFGFRVDPFAHADDGLLEAVLLRARTRTAVTRLLADARRGTHVQRPSVSWARAEEALIVTPLPMVADAEPLGVTTASVRSLPALLRMAVAPGASSVLGMRAEELAA